MLKPGMIVKATSEYEQEFGKVIRPIRIKSVQDVNTHYLVTLQNGEVIADRWLEPCLPTLGLLYGELDDPRLQVSRIKTIAGENLQITYRSMGISISIVGKDIRLDVTMPDIHDKWILEICENGEFGALLCDNDYSNGQLMWVESFKDTIDVLIDYYLGDD